MLTIWLLMPMTTVALLMVWIFVSQNKERLMDDAVPVGAGAGDTGNANALGEWLFGHDPDAISIANRARREHLMIDPRDWPGGVELRVPISAFGEPAPEHPTASIIDDDTGDAISISMANTGDGFVRAAIENDQLKRGTRFVLSDGGPDRDGAGFVDGQGRGLAEMSFSPQIPKTDHQVDDPLVMTLRIDTVYN